MKEKYYHYFNSKIQY